MIPRKQELEQYFQKYPDVPKEAIIKEDVLRLGLRFSQEALEVCKRYQLKSYFLFSFDIDPISRMTQSEHRKAPEDIRVTGGIYGLRPTVIAVRLSLDSPYLVDAVEGNLVLCDGRQSEPVAEVKLRRPPHYYSLSFKDGTSYAEICPLTYWGHCVYITVLRNCQYWGDKEECRFCDINANVRQQRSAGRAYTMHKSIDQVVEVLDAIFPQGLTHADTPPDSIDDEGAEERRPHFYVISGGTVVNRVGGKDDTDFYLQYARPVKEKIGHRWPMGIQAAAKTMEQCRRLREAGADVFLPNIEVWDKRLFAIMCPGKEKFIGRDQWIQRTIDAVDVFGEACVGPGFVAGVEMAQPGGFEDVDSAVESTGAGLDFLMRHGVVPRLLNWCREPLSALGGHPPIPLDYFVKIDMVYYELWKKYRLPPGRGFGPVGPGRATVFNSAYADIGF